MSILNKTYDKTNPKLQASKSKEVLDWSQYIIKKKHVSNLP